MRLAESTETHCIGKMNPGQQKWHKNLRFAKIKKNYAPAIDIETRIHLLTFFILFVGRVIQVYTYRLLLLYYHHTTIANSLPQKSAMLNE